jgi:hypothetical protein
MFKDFYHFILQNDLTFTGLKEAKNLLQEQLIQKAIAFIHINFFHLT